MPRYPMLAAVAAALSLSFAPARAASVWSGPEMAFTKADGADWLDPAHQDRRSQLELLDQREFAVARVQQQRAPVRQPDGGTSGIVRQTNRIP